MKRITKMGSYIRLALGLFLLLATFNIIQFFFLRLTVVYNMPYYIRERRDILLNIGNNIIREAEKNPRFNIKTYVAGQNKQYKKLKIAFVTEDQIEFLHHISTSGTSHRHTSLSHRRDDDLLVRVRLPQHRNRIATGLKIKVPQVSGYLVLFHSDEFNRLNAGTTTLTVFMLVSILLSLIVGFFIFRKGYRRSTELVAAAEKISAGNYEVRTNIPGNDEFSLIGKAFNNMAASIEKSTNELKMMDQQRRKFIADISHELATPLTSIQGFVETLRMEDLQLTPTEQREYLKIVWDETERLSFLIQDLLELARIDAGTMKLIYDRIDCQHFLEEFIKRNSIKLKEKQVQINYEIVPGQSIYGDYRRLEQIFQNLLDNALKHSGLLHQVTILFDQTSDKTVITFRDDGAGIPKEHLDHIFDVFYISSHPLGNSNSNGLGLSIVKRLVELHEGTIRIESREKAGTNFVLEFPREEIANCKS